FRPRDERPVRFHQEVRFVRAHLRGGAFFESTQFDGRADFFGIRVEESASFTTTQGGPPVRFASGFSFRNSYISGEASFRGIQVSPRTGPPGRFDADFYRIRVDGPIWFQPDARGVATIFHGSVFFVEAHIEGTADFSAAQFEKEASLDGTHFSGAAIFQPRADLPVRFHGPALFRSTVYSDEANFERTQFLVESRFFGARFGQGVDFGQVLFGGRADFRAC